MPKTSVIMGVYNGEKHLNKAIESILNQTYKDFEFIICDDASTDNSYSKIEEYMLKDDRIILLKNEVNLGLAATLNRCIEVSKGEYIARMDDDDISLPDRFQKQIKFLEEHPECTILGGGARIYDEQGEYGTMMLEAKPNKNRIFKGSAFIHPTIIIRKEALKEVNGYTVADYTRRTEDYDLWCKLYLAEYRGSNLQEVILKYYEGRNSYKKKKFIYRMDSIKLRSIWRKRLEIPFNIYLSIVFRIIVVALLPKKVIQEYHKIKFKS